MTGRRLWAAGVRRGALSRVPGSPWLCRRPAAGWQACAPLFPSVPALSLSLSQEDGAVCGEAGALARHSDAPC